MTFADDERAQSTLVGAILLFAILIVAFSSYQAFVVPSQNAGVEFNHNNEVQSDMQDLRNALLDVRSVQPTGDEYRIRSEHRPVRVRLGTRYPSRLLALNPPSPSGTIETVEPTTPLRIENARVKTPDSFDSDPDDALIDTDLETTFLVYRPGYAEYRDPPDTVLEHSLLYNEFESADRRVRHQTMIRPETNRLNIVLFDGDVSRSGTQAVTLDPETLDGPTASVPIESTGSDIAVQIPTRSPAVWEAEISELDDVTLQSSSSDYVRVSLDADEYDLRVTRVGFDGGENDTRFTPIQPIQQREVDANGTDSTFDTRWTERDQENGTVTAEPGEEIELTMRAVERGSDPERPIEDAAVDFSIEGDVDGAVLKGYDPVGETTNASGEQRLTLEIADAAREGDEFRAYATAGDDSDVVTVEIVAADDPAPSDAENVEVVPDSGGTFWGTDGVRFELENTGSDSATISEFTVADTTDPQATGVREANGGSYARGQHEVYVGASTEGVLETDGTPYWDDDGTPLPIGSTQPMTEPATIDSQAVGTVYIYAFRNSGGQIVSMSGRTITITLGFDDGSSATYTIEID